MSRRRGRLRCCAGGLVYVLATVATAYAELALETYPLAVTSRGSAAIVLEASSSHAAVRVFGPSEGIPQTTSTVLILQPSAWAEEAVSYSRMSFAEAALRRIGGPARLGVAVIRDDWDVDLSAFPDLPTPNARWLLRADPREAQSLARRLTRRWEEIRRTPQLSYSDYRAHSLEMFADALVGSRVLQVSSDGRLRSLPDEARFPTPLGWLYRAMLDEEGQSALAGCRFRPAYHAGGTVEGPWTLYTGLVDILEEQRPNSALGSIRDATRDVVGRTWWLPEALQLLIDALPLAALAVTDAATYAEFAIMGDIDPAAVEVAACNAHRLFSGQNIATRSIRERSVIYAETDRVLSEAWAGTEATGGAPRFFAAASHVTRLFGVGSADLLHAYSDGVGSFTSGQRDAWTNLSVWPVVDTRCLALPPGESYLPTRAGRNALRVINEKLFDFVNRSEMRWLVANPGSLRFPDGKARFETPSEVSPSLAFDLRMVMREQAAVDRLLGPNTLGLTERDTLQLTRSQRALYCLQFAGLARQVNTEPEALFQILDRVAGTLEALRNEGVIDEARADFSNYWYRVATGMAYMVALHASGSDRLLAQDGGDILADLLRTLINEERDRAASVSDLPAGVRQELLALVDAARAPPPDLSADLQRALEFYLAPDLADQPLMRCSEHQMARRLTTRPLGSAASQSQRVQVLAASGLRPLTMAFELMPGGALDRNAMFAGGAEGEALCAALEARRKSFAAAARGQSPTLLLDGADLLPGKRVLVFERALPLRREVGALAPFAVLALRPPISVSAPGDVLLLLREAEGRRAAYVANLALLARVASLERPQWTRISPNLDIPALSDLVRRAFPDRELGNVRPADLAALEARMDRMERIESIQVEMQPFVAEILAAFVPAVSVAPAAFERPGGFGDMRYDVQPGLRVDTGMLRTAAPGGARLLPAGGLLDGTLDIRMVPTGAVFDEETPFAGSPEFEAELFVRMGADASGLASAGRTRDARAIADSAVAAIPLGVTVRSLHVDERGRLQGMALLGTSYTNTDSARLRTALRSLGLPDFLMAETVQVRPEFNADRTLQGLFLTARLSIGEIRLGEVSVPLIANGRSVDVEDELRRAVEMLLDDTLVTALARSAEFTRLARLPQTDAEWAVAPVRFGIAIENGVAPTTHQLDWVGGTLTLGTRFELGLGLGAANRLVATAEAEILVGASDFAIHRLAFSENTGAVLSDFVARLVRRSGLEGALSESLSLVPVFDGETLHLQLRAGFAVAGCAVETGVPLPLDLVAIQGRLGAVLGEGVDDMTACAAGAAIAEIGDWLGDRSVTLFGITVHPILDRVRPEEAARALQEGGHVEIAVRVAGDALEDCRTLPPSEIVIGGLRLSRASGLDLGGMSPSDQAALGAVVLCRIEALLPNFGRSVLISNPSIGRDVVAADITLQDLPFLGMVPLGRIDFTDLGDGAVRAVRTAVERTAQTALSDVLAERIGGREVPLPGIGAFQLDAGDAVSIAILGETRDITLRGRLRFSEYRLPVSIVLSLEGGGVDVRPDSAALASLMSSEVLGAITAALPPLPGAPVQVDPFFFGPLDDRRLRWGLVFGAEARFDLGDHGIIVVVDRATISDDGLRLPPEIRLSLATPLVFPPGISLAKVLVIYRTDENPIGAGLELGAELTFLDPAVARLVKFVVLMDLRDMDRLAFFIEGDLVVLDTLPIFRAEADLELSAGRFEYMGTTAGPLREVLDLRLDGQVDLPKKVLATRSHLAVLGVDLLENALTICAERSGCVSRVPYGVRLESEHNLLITRSAVVARGDLDFGNPRLGASVQLSLFGWSPGGADFSADLRRVEVVLGFLGIEFGIVTPSVETMTPSHILAILKSLLDISLEDLLNADLSRITFSVASGDGSVSSTDGDNGDSDEPSGSDQRTGDDSVSPGGTESTRPPVGDPDDPDRARGFGAPETAEWGARADGYACQKFSGGSGRVFDSMARGERVHIEGRRGPIPTRWNYVTSPLEVPPRPLPLPANDEFWRRWTFGEKHQWLFTGAAANRYCELPPGGPIQMRRSIQLLGVARRPMSLYGACPEWRDGRVAAPRVRARLVPPDRSEEFSAAGLPVFCLPRGEVIGSHIFWDGSEIHVLFRCPHHVRLSEGARNHEYYMRLCGPGSGYLEIPAADAGISPTEVLDALDELDFLNRVVRPLALGEPIQPEGEQRRFSLSVATPDDTRVRVAHEANTGTLVFVIRRRDESGSETLEELRVTSNDPLFDVYSDRSGENAFARALLTRWLRSGQLPQEGIPSLVTAPDRVVLAAGSNQIEILDRRGRTVRAVTLILPTQRPSISGLHVATEIDMPDIFEALAPEIAGLPDETRWRVVLGHNVDRAYHSIAFVGEPRGPDAPLRILFDAYDPDAAAPPGGYRSAERITGDHRHAGLSTERAGRRHCWTVAARAAEIAGRYDPRLPEELLIDRLDDTIAAPDRYAPGDSYIETEHWDLVPASSASSLCPN